jgi:hypothetical protein
MVLVRACMANIIFFDYIVQLRHSQHTTLTYEHTHANYIPISNLEDWVGKSSRLTKSDYLANIFFEPDNLF